MQVNDNQYQELRRLGRTAPGRTSERAHYVLMREQGMTQQQIADAMNYSLRTVQRALRRYDLEGLDGLLDEPKSGRKLLEPHLTDIVETQAGQLPTSHGYLQTMWTVALLGVHLFERFKVKVSTSTVRRALHAVRFSWHRPKHTPARKSDPNRAEKEARLAQVLALPPAQTTLIAADECEIHLLAVLRAMWQRVGEQQRLPTPGQNRKRGIFGGLNVRTGQWTYLLAEHKRTADFIDFLVLLTAAYTTEFIFVIVDNASIHSSKILKMWLAQQPRIQLVYLPTYSGHQLNPVEKVWWQLKRYIAANRNFKVLEDLDTAVHRCCRAFTPHSLLALTNCHVNRTAQLALQQPIPV